PRRRTRARTGPPLSRRSGLRSPSIGDRCPRESPDRRLAASSPPEKGDADRRGERTPASRTTRRGGSDGDMGTSSPRRSNRPCLAEGALHLVRGRRYVIPHWHRERESSSESGTPGTPWDLPRISRKIPYPEANRGCAFPRPRISEGCHERS